MRSLDLKCESPSSDASARTVVQLGKLPLATRKGYLHNAVIWDLPHLVRCVLQELSADARVGERGATSLCLAAIEGNVRALKALLKGGANHALADTGGATPLYEAASHGHLECLQVLLEAGADTSAADRLGNTPLIGAVINRHVECVRALLPVSDLSQLTKDGRNALHTCVQSANEECFELLLPLMEDVDARTVQGVDEHGDRLQIFHQTSLHIASVKGQMTMARALLKRGADRMSLDNTQRSPLHWAAGAGALSCVILLVGRHEKPLLTPEQLSAVDFHGWSALHWAARFGHEKVCGVLLAVGAKLETKDIVGATPLRIAQQNNPDNAALLEMLSGNGPANLPGTVCDHCGKPAGRRMLACGICQNVRYCDSACQVAAWPGHKAECEKEKAARDRRTRVENFEGRVLPDPSSSSMLR